MPADPRTPPPDSLPAATHWPTGNLAHSPLQRTRRYAAAVLAGLLLATTAQSQAPTQTTTTPTTGGNTYETHPAADPSRPTVTNPAHIPPPGYLQFEQGFLYASKTPNGPDGQLSLVQTTKIALNHHLMPFFSSEPLARSSASGQSATDPGDLDLGLQAVLLDAGEGHSHVPTLAISYINRVRSGAAANLDVGSYKRSLLLLASGDALGLHYDANLVANQQVADAPNLPGHAAPRRAQWGQTLSLGRNLTPKLSLSGEIWRFSQPLTGGNAIGNLYAAAYTLRPTLVLDAGVSRGLTGTSTHWETFAGFTYLLPHRLWPPHHPQT